MSKPQDPLLTGGRTVGYGEIPGSAVTLRDLFAAFALAGDLSVDPKWLSKSHLKPEDAERGAKRAYLFADALLNERSKTREET